MLRPIASVLLIAGSLALVGCPQQPAPPASGLYRRKVSTYPVLDRRRVRRSLPQPLIVDKRLPHPVRILEDSTPRLAERASAIHSRRHPGYGGVIS
jgi:hypothetical protein